MNIYIARAGASLSAGQADRESIVINHVLSLTRGICYHPSKRGREGVCNKRVAINCCSRSVPVYIVRPRCSQWDLIELTMASSDIVPALQQGLLQKETESRTGVYSSQNPTSITGGEQGVVPHSNVTSPTISKNQSVVSIAERKADVSVQGVRIQAHNLAIRTESAKLHASGPTPGEPQINNQHQLPNVQAALPSAQATDTDRAIVPQTPRSPVLQDGAGQAVAHLERTGEAAKRSDELNIQTLKIQIDDLEIGIVRGEAIVQGERQVVRQEIETTDDGES